MPDAPPDIQINRKRLLEHIDTMASMTVPGSPYTRRAFSEPYAEARRWLSQRFEEAGLQVFVDAGGNLVGRRPGSTGAADIAIGSHIDTVQGGGRFDGILGVLAALECAQSLSEAGVSLRHGLRVIDFLSEEPSEYGTFFVGSQALVGRLPAADLDRRAPDGERLGDAIARVGGNPGALGARLVEPGELAAFVELHIEQGPVLETESVAIGVVEGIVGIVSKTVRLVGKASHAGTTPMALRKDALVGAAELIKTVDAVAGELAEEEYFVATIGRLEVLPNGANVVPGEVNLTLEARSLDLRVVERFFDVVLTQAGSVLRARGLELDVRDVGRAEPVASDSRIENAVEEASKLRGLSSRRLVSGAGHDAMMVAHVAPVGMIFVPSANGLSHHPDEFTADDDVGNGAQVLLDTVLRLDATL